MSSFIWKRLSIFYSICIIISISLAFLPLQYYARTADELDRKWERQIGEWLGINLWELRSLALLFEPTKVNQHVGPNNIK